MMYEIRDGLTPGTRVLGTVFATRLFFLSVLAMLCPGGYVQVIPGTLSDIVQDATGAVIPDAELGPNEPEALSHGRNRMDYSGCRCRRSDRHTLNSDRNKNMAGKS
jgi:hypothetical protein